MTTSKIIKEIVDELRKRYTLSCDEVEFFGDGYFCRHHVDDPAHGDSCYSLLEHRGIDKWIESSLNKAIEQEKERIVGMLKKEKTKYREMRSQAISENNSVNCTEFTTKMVAIDDFIETLS